MYDFSKKFKLGELMHCVNIAALMDPEDLKYIGQEALQGYTDDLQSREQWAERSRQAMELALQVVTQKTFPWQGCYTLDTDVLTDEGWRPIADVQISDSVYSRDATGRASFTRVTETFRHHADELVHFTGKSIDLLVTRNHNMLLQNKTGKQFFKRADAVLSEPTTNRYVPLTSTSDAYYESAVHGIPAKAYARFMGWFLSEGYSCYGGNTYTNKQGGFVNYGLSTSSFGLCQKRSVNPEKYEVMRADIEACGFTYKAREWGFIVHAKSMPQEFKDELRVLGRAGDKYIPRHALQLAPTIQLQMLETLLLGDGHTTKRGAQTYYTISKRLADDVQELCQYVGLRATIVTGPAKEGGMIRGRKISGSAQNYTISINRKPRIQVAKLQRSLVPYNGDVACVETLPHNTLYVRRNGKAVWCGNSSNVKFPLVTVAALQYQAMAYPAIIDAPDIVKCQVYGTDPDGSKSARADRVATHMSWQNLEQDTGWEEAHDKGLLVQAIAGNAFIKKMFDPVCRHQVTQLVLPENFVINYFTQNIDGSPRYTHTFDLSENAIKQREIDGRFVVPPGKDYENDSGGGTDSTMLEKTQPQTDSQLVIAKDERQGLTMPQVGRTTPYFTGEQYCWWDLDGDGLAEPYIVTFDIGTGTVRRIVARYLPTGVYLNNGKCITEYENGSDRKDNPIYTVPSGLRAYDIRPVKVFIKIPFVPSPDGGFYDLGLGSLLGPINESVNTAINQIFDAGTMATLGGGFLGRGFKNRGGPFTFRPFEWYPIDAPGDDLHKNILPLPVREPSAVLFQLLGLLIQYGERIISTNEIQAGESPGQNTPAETTRTLDQNGRRMTNAVYKRTWRAFRDEYRIQYSLNQQFLAVSEDYHNLVTGSGAMILADDYRQAQLDVCPAADPFIISDAQQVQQAMQLVQMANQLPGFNRYQTTLRALKKMKVQGIEEIYPQLGVDQQTGKPMQDFPAPPPDPKMIQAQVAQGKLQLQMQESQQEAMRSRIELMLSVQKIGAEILNLQSQATLYEAQAKTAESEPAIKLIYAQIEAQSIARDHILRVIDTLTNLHLEHKKLAVDARKDGVNMPGIQSPADAMAQSVGTTLGSLQ